MQSIAEIWKDIQGYEGLYQVSNLGRVKSLGRNIKKPLTKIGYVWQSERILKGRKDTKGYLRVVLYKDQTPKGFKVHRLVAVAFIPNPENKPEVDHINRDKTDNSVNNLRWVSHKENMNNSLTIAFLFSVAKAGKNHPRARAIRNIDTKEIFDTIEQASKRYSISHSAIIYAIKNNGRSAGFKWEYV